MPIGKVKWYNEKGFGKIDIGKGKDLFVHIKQVINANVLAEGQEVEYEVNQFGKKGPEAKNVKVLSNNSINKKQFDNQKYDHFNNPFNFVRWSKPANDKSEFVRKAPPSHLTSKGISGVIKCTLKTETPLFISGNIVKSYPNCHQEYEFFKKDGKYTIPGSSLRGMIRSIHEAVTNSSYSILNENEENTPLFFRGDPRSMPLKLIPARVVKNDGRYFVELLTGHATKQNTRYRSHAAWVLKYGHKWRGNPDSNDLYSKRTPLSVPNNINHGDEVYAILSAPILHKSGRFEFRNVEEISKDINKLSNPAKAIKGYYFQSGLNFGRKHDERFFYRVEVSNLPDNGTYPYENNFIEIDETHYRRYNQLIDNYKEVNESSVPQKGTEFSRHITNSTHLKEGDLVYVELKNNNQELEDMYPVMISRKQYYVSVLDLLPEHLRHPQSYDDLCPTSRLFGWVKGEDKVESKDVRKSYKSRVQFSDAVISKFNGSETRTLGILGTPKPTAIPLYLRSSDDKAGSHKGKYIKNGYNNEDVTIRGRKMFLSHSKFEGQNDMTREKFNRTVKDALIKDNEFKFEIKVSNLSEVELGSLLWSLQLEHGMNHRLGYGKPFGLGQVIINIDSFTKIDGIDRYKKWDNEFAPVELESLTSFVSTFKQEMKNAFDQEFEKITQVKDLIAILTPDESGYPIHYPRPKNSDKTFDWFVNNKKVPKSMENTGLTYKEVLPFPDEKNAYLNYN